MRIKIFAFFAFVSSLLIFSCGEPEPKGAFVLKGQIENAEDLTTYFDKIDLSNAIESLAQTNLKNGKFSVALPQKPSKGLYRVRIGAKSAMILLDGTEDQIEILADLSKLPKAYTVNGSALSSEFASKNEAIYNKTLKEKDLDAYLSNDATPLVAMALSSAAYGSNFNKHEIFSKISNKLKDKYGADDKLVEDYSALATRLAQAFAKNQAKYKVRVGQPAPEIVSTTPKGKEMKLSDLKGKVVLLDFWASWCGPCRRANPYVVETYKKYKNKGFTVFNVSLDGIDERTKARLKSPERIQMQMESSKTKWLAAIEKDQLNWPYHVSDLRKWDSVAASAYGVRSIPSTFLIDRDGNLAVLNPNKKILAREIEKLL